MVKKYVEIVVDTNDADYATSRHEIDDDSIVWITKVANAIAAFKKTNRFDHNWWNMYNVYYEEKTPNEIYKGVLTEQEIDWFNDYCPSTEEGFHSVESITILEIINETELL